MNNEMKFNEILQLSAYLESSIFGFVHNLLFFGNHVEAIKGLVARFKLIQGVSLLFGSVIYSEIRVNKALYR